MTLQIEATGLLATVQDQGRIGWAHLGVPRAGALDLPAAQRANRLVGNGAEAAVIEVTMGGLIAVNRGPGRWAAVTGAIVPLTVSGGERGGASPDGADRSVADHAPFWWPAGARLVVGLPVSGVRSYLAAAGGIAVAPVLGSRSTDVLAEVGPPLIHAGQSLPLGEVTGPPSEALSVVVRRGSRLRVARGPRDDWFTDAAHRVLVQAVWQVRPEVNRIGVRLAGPVIERVSAYEGRELASEPMVLGAIQVPPDGQPIVFLADHPTTGGYPVIGVVDPADLWQCAQLRPGDLLRFRSG